MSERKGPWEIFRYGTYMGQPIENVIEKDPMFFAKCVKNFLNITPKQSEKFFEITGYDIPSEFVVENMNEKLPDRWPYGIEPNYNFDNETF